MKTKTMKCDYCYQEWESDGLFVCPQCSKTPPPASGDRPSDASEAGEVEQARRFCRRLRNGADRMGKARFCEAMRKAINADEDYSARQWVQFTNNPAAWLAHRQPQSQSVEVLRVILAITANDQPDYL